MRKYREVQVTRSVFELEYIQCNACGKSYSDFNTLQVKYTGGYRSSGIGDTNTIKFDVCEACLIKWAKKFRIAPEYTDIQGNSVELK